MSDGKIVFLILFGVSILFVTIVSYVEYTSNIIYQETLQMYESTSCNKLKFMIDNTVKLTSYKSEHVALLDIYAERCLD